MYLRTKSGPVCFLEPSSLCHLSFSAADESLVAGTAAARNSRLAFEGSPRPRVTSLAARRSALLSCALPSFCHFQPTCRLTGRLRL